MEGAGLRVLLKLSPDLSRKFGPEWDQRDGSLAWAVFNAPGRQLQNCTLSRPAVRRYKHLKLAGCTSAFQFYQIARLVQAAALLNPSAMRGYALLDRAACLALLVPAARSGQGIQDPPSNTAARKES